VKTVTATLCVLTILALACLSLSVVILRPPRANYAAWAAFATIVCMQTAATLVAIRTDAARLRTAVVAGGVALAAAGAWMIRHTLTSAHFEGYALILGAMLVAQGIVTVAAFARRPLVRGTV
jgi:hypothetical protein